MKMIKISATILFEGLKVEKEAKSFSDAWNKIREIRDEFESSILDGSLIKITLPEGMKANEKILPLEILMKENSKGKIEFKDMQKIRNRMAKQLNEASGEFYE